MPRRSRTSSGSPAAGARRSSSAPPPARSGDARPDHLRARNWTVDDLPALLDRSLEVISEHQAPTGAYLASPTFGPYRYSWLRDGAFIADAVSRAGDPSSADRFFGWCARVITARRPRIDALLARAHAGDAIAIDEHLHARFTADGQEADEPWWTFQLDGYGTWLWALEAHHRRHRGDLAAYGGALLSTVRYLVTFWDEPCYDWWEEHATQRHTSTLAAVSAGLEAAMRTGLLPDADERLAMAAATSIRARIHAEGVQDGHLTKWLGTDAVDASLAACIAPYGLYLPDDPVAVNTLAMLDRQLAPAGVYRYLDDVYYGGGQWVLLAGFLGWAHLVAGNTARAEALLAWMVEQADPDGHLPEQLANDLLHPEHEQGWIERWGPSASPLLWSHAMLLTLAHELGYTAAPTPDRREVRT
ncbi:MAG: glycoside hydrolase family 15 [Nitriliruptor sp.]|nr:MAG: glycoside hydrolase family 15 [Nitriliruptor sp.]